MRSISNEYVVTIWQKIPSYIVHNLTYGRRRKLYGYNNVMAVSKYIQLFAEITEENWVTSRPKIGAKLAAWPKGVGVTATIGVTVKA